MHISVSFSISTERINPIDCCESSALDSNPLCSTLEGDDVTRTELCDLISLKYVNKCYHHEFWFSPDLCGKIPEWWRIIGSGRSCN